MDFGALPPEINSGLMHSGPGSGPMLAAAQAWAGLAVELTSAASGYDAVISGLTGQAWSGPTAAAMTAAVRPYLAWMCATAGQAEQSATQARAAAAAYEAAFTATVPPPVIAANRSLLLTLITTNVLGQNTAAIATTEAHYAQMWAQDAAAMYGYAGASASAASVSPFNTPPATTNSVAAATGTGPQTALSQLIAMVPPALQGLASSAMLYAPQAAQATSPIITLLNFLAGPTSPISLFSIGGIPYLLAIQCVLLPMNGSNVLAAVTKASAAGLMGAETTVGADELAAGLRLMSSSGPMTPAVSAGLGNSGTVGRLSVPHSWAVTAPESDVAGAPVAGAAPGGAPVGDATAADGQGGLMSSLALGGLAGRAIGVTGGAASRAGGATGLAAASKPTKATQATIIVIPPSARD